MVVHKDGKVTYKQKDHDDASLVQALSAGGHPPPKVSLHADAEADAGRVADVIALIGMMQRQGSSDGMVYEIRVLLDKRVPGRLIARDASGYE